jgi:transposase-like protein
MAIEKLGLEMGEIEGDPIEELGRYAAKLVLTSYLHAEATEYLGAGRYERTAGRRGSRNGSRPRKVSLGLGTVQVEYPKMRDVEAPFRSAILEAWQRKSATLAATLPNLYVEGLSTRDYDRALGDLWEGTSLSRSTVSRANEAIKQGFQKWRRRSLEDESIAYLFLDGYYEGVRFGTKGKEALLIVHGIRSEGSRVLLGVYMGEQESAESWKLALQDVLSRGLKPPWMVISDGNPGLIRAVKDTWGKKMARQRCIVHKTRNVLSRVPKSEQAGIRRELNRIFYALSLEEALKQAGRFAAKHKNVYPSAVETLGRDLAECLSFFRMPPRHWARIRTSNPLERALKEVRRRTRVIGRFPTEVAALSLVWSVMDEDAKKWRGIIMDDYHRDKIHEGLASLQAHPIQIEWMEELLAA